MTHSPSQLLDRAFADTLAQWSYSLEDRDRAVISGLQSGVIELEGFASIAGEELIALPNSTFALASYITQTKVGAILLGEDTGLEIGGTARRTRRNADIYVGDALKGRIVTPLCAHLKLELRR
jgi:F-type H+-transporting ATPase subunit alpha